MREWFRLATRQSIVSRGLAYSVVVGTVLTAINQGDIIMAGQCQPTHFAKIGLTYLVPYVVSTLSSVGAIRSSVRNS
ncbi:hypothetical protein K227x_39180 [Rubripirellula lacrimiformis]|uniref:Phosphoenolpyruvate protein kinase n=2 Tax=Rubripirellula lacrimiformis TaxID=1930273 RepID=A0A517NEN5_9BACT|nr:hypothetical protein K227x_39180 [Rubripirellula lacrimiformis]